MMLKSEIFDKIQFLFETYKFNDHNLHCIIYFNGNANKVILEKALAMTLDVVPILGSQYVENVNEPYWRKEESSSFKEILTFANSKDEFEAFITSKIDVLIGPQVKACLLSSNNDSLCILMNHMVCDAAGFKTYLYLLCSLYSTLLVNPDYKSDCLLDGDRSIKLINRQFSFGDKLKNLLMQRGESNGSIDLNFPMSSGEEIKPFVLMYEVKEDRFLAIKKYSHGHNVTINDITLAAFYRVLYQILAKQDLSISIAVDMRKYLKNKNINALTNLTATAISKIHYEPDDTFDDTVRKVSKEMNLKKKNLIGLNVIVKVSLLFKCFKYKHVKKLLGKGFHNPMIGMTNIGILDSKKLCFRGTSIKNAVMFGSMKYRPYFQLALTSYNNTMTFTVNLYGDLQDKYNMETFFSLLDKELQFFNVK